MEKKFLQLCGGSCFAYNFVWSLKSKFNMVYAKYTYDMYYAACLETNENLKICNGHQLLDDIIITINYK